MDLPPRATFQTSGNGRKELKSRVNDLSVTFPSVIADFIGKPDQARKKLEFWKSLGVIYVVSEPPMNSIDMLEPLFAEYGMQLALHNHQRGKSGYWHPDIHTHRYRALVSIDFEHDTPQLQEDMLKNIAFIEEQARLLG